jgi:nicotinate (nicotinamide) nucleotide adenylyltransferase
MKKIGLLLGSFDPIHVAHINIAACALNSGLCDKVLFVVAKHNPWKKAEPATFDLRCKMIEAAIEPFGDKAEVCRFEEEFEPPVYSYLPIGKAIETYPDDEIYLLAGTDTIERISHWKNFETHIKDKVGFIEVSRGDKGDSLPLDSEKPFEIDIITLANGFNKYRSEEVGLNVKVLRIKRMDVSSTIVRKAISDGMNPYPYVTKEVLKIIQDNNLYKNG